MYLLLCYDVVDDNRRNRLHKRLKGYLRPVQKSVFEGRVPGHRYGGLLRVVQGAIDHQTDTVRIYHLCGGCRRLIELVGTAEPVPQEAEDVVV